MEMKTEEKMPLSVLQGERISINKLRARDSSLSRSPHRGAEGVPFKWEMYPGRAKNLLEEDAKPLPLCPSPLMQSLGLPLPNLDHNKPNELASKTSRLIKMVKKRINGDVLRKVGEIVLDRKGNGDKEGSEEMQHVFEFNGGKKIFGSDEKFEASSHESGSVLSLPSDVPMSKGDRRETETRWGVEGSNLSCGPWFKRGFHGFTIRKLKSFLS